MVRWAKWIERAVSNTESRPTQIKHIQEAEQSLDGGGNTEETDMVRARLSFANTVREQLQQV